MFAFIPNQRMMKKMRVESVIETSILWQTLSCMKGDVNEYTHRFEFSLRDVESVIL